MAGIAGERVITGQAGEHITVVIADNDVVEFVAGAVDGTIAGER